MIYDGIAGGGPHRHQRFKTLSAYLGPAISFYRVGGKIVITEADVDAYLASCRVEAVTLKAAASRVQVSLKHLRLN